MCFIIHIDKYQCEVSYEQHGNGAHMQSPVGQQQTSDSRDAKRRVEVRLQAFGKISDQSAHPFSPHENTVRKRHSRC